MAHRTKIFNTGGPLGYVSYCTCGHLGPSTTLENARLDAANHFVAAVRADKDQGKLDFGQQTQPPKVK